MWQNPDKPYNDLPPLPPEADLMTGPVLKVFTAATRSLSELHGAYKRLPDPTVLINLIPLMEAQASSEIENIVTTNDELFRAAHDALSHVTPQVKEALRYREALHAGHRLVLERGFSTSIAMTVASHIQGHDVSIRHNQGTYIGNPATQERIYTPPQGADIIQRHLDKWEHFMNDPDQVDPLISMALGHYQFEAIHPFNDGNGRTGRILNSLYLTHRGLMRLPVLYLSGYITRTKSEYYSRLRAVTEHEDWENWLIYMFTAVTKTSEWTLGLIDATAQHRTNTETIMRTHHSRIPAGDLGKLLYAQPYLRIRDVVEAQLAKRQTASKWLEDLVDLGILRVEQIGREKIFINQGLLDLFFSRELAT